MNEKIDAHTLTPEQFDRACRAFAHREILTRRAADSEAYLVAKGFKEATPPTPPADLPNAKPFDARTDAYLRQQFPAHDQYVLKKYGLKETK
jgi:hypothetical protein